MTDSTEPLRSPALRPDAAANYLKVSRRTLDGLFNSGELVRIRIGGAVLVLVEDLDDLLRRKRGQAATAA